MIEIITHIFHVKLIPNFFFKSNNLYCLCECLIFCHYHQLFHLLQSCKNIFYQAIFFIKSFKTVHVLVWISSFCLRSFKFLELNSLVKYLKSSSARFLISCSRLEFINCILSIKTKFLFQKNVISFSNLFGITSIFTSDLLSPQKIK